MTGLRSRSVEIVRALREADGDVMQVAEDFNVKPTNVYQVARRAGVSITALKFGAMAHGAVTDAPHAPADTDETSVTLSRADYISLVAQARSVGAVWHEADRIIAILTRNCEDIAAQLVATGGYDMADRAYSYEELGELKPQILAIAERVRQDNPQAWKDAHNGNFDETSTRYNDLTVQALRAAGIFAGCNGKRGGSQRSDDVLVFGLQAGQGGAQDTSGRFPEIAIIDYIGSAGDPDIAKRSITWGDVSKASPGRFLDPQGLARIDGAVTPPVDPPPPSPDPNLPPSGGDMDLNVLNAKLDALLAAVGDLKNQTASAPSRSDIRQEMNELVLGPEVMGFLRPELNEIKNKPASGGSGCVFRR
jgi:hypothetical protein